MKTPNILLIVSDQQRPDCVGALGKIAVKTPALDRLCAEGTAFERAYTPCPLCTPARASLLTGQYPSRHGAWNIGTDTPPDSLPLPQILRERAGYRSAIIGKSHLVSCCREGSLEAPPRSQDFEFFKRWNGPYFGFDFARINVGHVHEPHAYSMHYGLWLQERGIKCELPYFFVRQPTTHPNAQFGRWELPEEHHHAKWAVDESIAYLREHQQNHAAEPFYLCLNFAEPHQPWRVPAPWDTLHDDVELPPAVRCEGETQGKSSLFRATVETHANSLGWHDHFGVPEQYGGEEKTPVRSEQEKAIWRIYLGMTSLLDHHLERVLNALDELDLTRDTIVVFTSDHGDHMGDHWLWGKGGSHYRAAAGVPFLVRWPQKTPANRRSQSLQSLVDIAPTFLAAAGVEIPAEMQGTNQIEAWQNPDFAVRRGVLIDHRVTEGLYLNSWITDSHRLSQYSIVAEGRDETEVFDLQNDENEFCNLAAQGENTALTLDLMGELLRYRMQIGGPYQARLGYA